MYVDRNQSVGGGGEMVVVDIIWSVVVVSCRVCVIMITEAKIQFLPATEHYSIWLDDDNWSLREPSSSSSFSLSLCVCFWRRPYQHLSIQGRAPERDGSRASAGLNPPPLQPFARSPSTILKYIYIYIIIPVESGERELAS
jgi:hypothetical protein